MRKGEANPGVVVVVVMGEAQEAAEDHNHIQVQRVEQVEQEVEAAHSHNMQEVQVVKMMVHPYLGTSRHNMPHQTLPDPAASLQLCRRRRNL